MGQSVSDFIIDRLIEWDLHQFYGFPGDGIGGFDGALGRGQRDGKDFTYIRPTHEEIAAFMATAHAKFTGEVGVCIATSGPGAIHLLNGLYDAKMDHQPVVAIVGQQGRVSFGSDAQQEMDLERLFQDVAGFVETVTTPMQAQMVLDRAVRIARAQNCPAVVILPADIQTMDMETPTAEHWVSRTGVGHASKEIAPPEDELRRAADVLNAGKKVAMMVGQGARGATDEVIAVADKLGAGVVTALLGKDVLPGDLPYHTQQLGLLGSKPSYDMMQDCDTLLMVGTNYPYAEFLPPTGNARGVQIDISHANLSLRYPMEVALAGDAKATLAALLPHLQQQEDRSWQEGVVKGMEDWDQVTEAIANADANPINPRLVYHELNKRLPYDSIVTADAGSTADWYGHHIKLGREMSGNLSGTLATMLASMPYAISAKFAHPGRPVVCTIGDGAFQMLGMNELLTIKRHWKDWDDPRFIILILNNHDLTQVSFEMREAGDPRWDTAQKVEEMDYAAYGELMGLRGIKITKPDELQSGLDEAFKSDRPVVLDIHTDPNVPPLPAHISFDEAKGFIESLAKGDPAEFKLIGDSFRAVAAELFAKARNILPGGNKD